MNAFIFVQLVFNKSPKPTHEERLVFSAGGAETARHPHTKERVGPPLDLRCVAYMRSNSKSISHGQL